MDDLIMINSLIIIGCSGVGKGTIIKNLLRRHKFIEFVLSFTTRKRRNSQIDGIDYYFVSHEAFKQKVRNGEMLESKQVFGQYYGTSKMSYQKIVKSGKIALMDVDIEGMLDIRKTISQHHQLNSQHHNCQVLCILPPSWEVLRQRLRSRGTESDQFISSRMNQNLQQYEKMKKLSMTDLFFVTNYQYQLTTYGIQLFVGQKYPEYRTR